MTIQRSNAVIPNWSMPPKVLLVEDDDTCRRFGSRLLQIFGCPFDVAEDGVAAVGKMTHQKYDIVLMVRKIAFFDDLHHALRAYIVY